MTTALLIDPDLGPSRERRTGSALRRLQAEEFT